MDLVDLNLSSLLPQLSNPNYQEQNEYPSVQFAAREGAYNGSFAKRPLELKTIANSPNISTLINELMGFQISEL